MSKALSAILALAFLIASLSCQSLFGVSDTQGVSTSSIPVTKLSFLQKSACRAPSRRNFFWQLTKKQKTAESTVNRETAIAITTFGS